MILSQSHVISERVLGQIGRVGRLAQLLVAVLLNQEIEDIIVMLILMSKLKIAIYSIAVIHYLGLNGVLVPRPVLPDVVLDLTVGHVTIKLKLLYLNPVMLAPVLILYGLISELAQKHAWADIILECENTLVVYQTPPVEIIYSLKLKLAELKDFGQTGVTIQLAHLLAQAGK